MTSRRLVRARRGAVLPLVAVLIVALVGFVALAVDLGRMYLGGAELQTAADAGALAAAGAVQRDASHPASAAIPAAGAFAARHRALGATAEVAPADVRPLRYDPATSALADAAWSDADAIAVVSRVEGTYLFGGVLGAVMPRVARRSIAWIGSVNAAACIKPWVLPHDALAALAGSVGSPTPDLTRAQLGQIQALAPSARTVVLLPPGGATASPEDGEWEGADFTGGASLGTFGDWVAGVGCATAAADVDVPALALQAADDADVVAASNARVAQACTFRTFGSALCHAGASAVVAGAPVRVVWADVDPAESTCLKRGNGNAHGNCKRKQNNGNGNGNGNAHGSGAGAGGSGVSTATVRMIGQLVVLCYFRSSADVCPAQPGYPDGGWMPPASSGYPAGTIIGVVNGVASTELGADVRLGTRVSQLQRLVLVQ